MIKNLEQNQKPTKSIFSKIILFVLLLALFASVQITISLFKKRFQLDSQILDLKIQLQDAKQTVKEKKFTPTKIDSWQQFSDPSYSFSFKYPLGWNIKKHSENQISVSNYVNSCKECSVEEKNNYYEFYIKRELTKEKEMTGKKKTKNALYYLLQDWINFLDFETEQYEKATKEGKDFLPTVPGFTQRFVAEAYNLFPSGISAVEVSPYFFSPHHTEKGIYLVENEYLLIDDNYRVYTINLISPGYSIDPKRPTIEEQNHPLVEIIKSLGFLLPSE